MFWEENSWQPKTVNYSGEKWRLSVVVMWHRNVVVITAAQLHATKPELRFCTGSNPARGVLEIRDGEDL